LAIGLIAPLQVIPEIKVIQTLHLSGSYLAVILIEAATWIPFATFLYSGFIRSLPSELEEAAIIDGCGPIMVWLRIVLPLLKPATSTLVVLLFTGIWNDFQIPLYFINDQSRYTMPLTLFNFSGLHTADYNLLCADIVMTIVPVMIVFFIAQKYIIAGLVDGATK
jgi:raffinose/stachyose/melibiose transport system permease protein